MCLFFIIIMLFGISMLDHSFVLCFSWSVSCVESGQVFNNLFFVAFLWTNCKPCDGCSKLVLVPAPENSQTKFKYF
jgi:hypothetical protein